MATLKTANTWLSRNFIRSDDSRRPILMRFYARRIILKTGKNMLERRKIYFKKYSNVNNNFL